MCVYVPGLRVLLGGCRGRVGSPVSPDASACSQELMKDGGGQDCREHQLPVSFPSVLSGFIEVCYCSVTNSCPTLCDPMDCSPPGSSVHGILQAGILEWVAISGD